MQEKRQHDAACLDLFRNQQYDQALPYFRAFERRADLDDRDRLKTKLNVAKCLLEVREGAGPDWADQFRQDLREYLRVLGGAPAELIAPQPIREYFEAALRFHLDVEPLADLRRLARETYHAFACRTARKLKPEDYIQTTLAEVERERRNFARPDHARRATELALALLEELAGDDRYRSHAAATYNLLADLAYFFPLHGEPDNERFRRVGGYLEAALALDPHDGFARRFKEHVDRLARTTLQIKRFGHDTQTRLGNIHARLDQLQRQLPPGGEAQAALLNLRREVSGLTVLGKLIEGKQPAAQDWAVTDPADLVLPLLRERGWPDSCLERVGPPSPWELCPGFVTIALENLLRNTAEAYGRTHRTPPSRPCAIRIDYPARALTIRDWAGGIDAKLGDVFEPYVSSKGVQANTGLGLTQAREALQVQSRSFTLELTDPQPPDGAEFRLHFPR
jgi:hypothetical protein